MKNDKGLDPYGIPAKVLKVIMKYSVDSLHEMLEKTMKHGRTDRRLEARTFAETYVYLERGSEGVRGL